MRRFHQKSTRKRQNVTPGRGTCKAISSSVKIEKGSILSISGAWDLSKRIPRAISDRMALVASIFIGSRAILGQNKVPRAFSSPGSQQATMEKRWFTSNYDVKTRLIFKKKEARRSFFTARNRGPSDTRTNGNRPCMSISATFSMPTSLSITPGLTRLFKGGGL